jgi:phosphotransferase system HPr (HPr) family protein
MIGSPFGTRPPQTPPPAAPGGEGACASLHEGQDAMPGDTYQHKVLITNPNGFHLRPMTAFAELAQRFQSQVTVSKDGRPVDGKSAWELMTLVALQGSELVVQASGPDAPEALKALVGLLENFSYDEDVEPPLPQKG